VGLGLGDKTMGPPSESVSPVFRSGVIRPRSKGNKSGFAQMFESMQYPTRASHGYPGLLFSGEMMACASRSGGFGLRHYVLYCFR
jgi:hypothetical protein